MVKCQECDDEFEIEESLRRHVKKHGMLLQNYVLKWKHSGIRPKCHCGCGVETAWNVALKDFAVHVLGHHAFGREKSVEEKAKIGRANSVNMKRYMKEHPEIAQQKIVQLASGRTEEVYERVSKSVNAFWSSGSDITEQRRKEASDRAIDLLSQGKIGPQAPFKTEYKFNPFSNREEYMHSGWETELLDEAIRLKFPITKTHNIRIPYVKTSGYGGTYVPDFVSEDAKLIIEVKGEEDPDDLLKYVAGDVWSVEHGWRYVVIKDNADIRRTLKCFVT